MWHEVPAVDVGSRSVSISTENNAGLELVNIAVLIKLALEHFFDRNHGVIETGKFFLESSAIFDKSFEFFDKTGSTVGA